MIQTPPIRATNGFALAKVCKSPRGNVAASLLRRLENHGLVGRLSPDE